MPETAALLADIGGTNARFARCRAGQRPDRMIAYHCADYPDLASAIAAACTELAITPGRAAFAVAGPVGGDRVSLTNHHWEFSIAELRRRFGLAECLVVNDFEAIANALPHLPESSLEQIGGGAPAPSGTKVVLGPGTGIGVAGLVLTGDGWRAVGGEGGHVSVAVEDDFESDLLAFLRRQLGHVSYESLVSGPGLVRLAHAIADMTDIPFADWSGEQVSTPADVTRLATAEPGGPAGQAVAVFARLLGGFAGDLALILGALGGVYVAGGVVSHLGGQFDRAGFRQRFEAKGRFADYLAAIPAYLITEENPGLLGLSTMLSPGD